MADFTEELEPLFDYSRVQPLNYVCLDDDDSLDEVPIEVPVSVTTNEKEEDEKKETIVVDCGKTDDDDWLRSPPRISGKVHSLEEDSTIKELRLKRQELFSITQSAQDVFRAVEESAAQEFRSSLKASEEAAAEPLKTTSERAKIVISVQDKDGVKQVRIFKDDKFEKLFKSYADKVMVDGQCVTFTFDGDKINPSETPDSLGMEDDDMIEVHIKAV